MTRSAYCPLSEIRTIHGGETEQQARASTSTSQRIGVESTADHNKLLGLELLRFVSAVAVLIFHYQHFVFRGVAEPTDFVRTHQPLYSVLSLLYEYGFEGVRVFWCISGFIFFWRYRDLIAGGRVGGRKFLVLRSSRLYPLHFATLLLVALLQLIYSRSNGTFFVYPYNDLRHFIAQLFMASNWGFQRGDSFNGPIWSISLEVLVYGVFYLTLAFVSRSWLVNVIVVALCGVARILGIHHPIFDCLVFFYVGGLSAIAYRSITSPRMRSVSTGAALFSAAGGLLLVWGFALYQRAGFPFVFLVCYTPLLLFCLCADFKVGPLARFWIEAAGNMTYASYLLHFPLQLALVIVSAGLGFSLPFYSTGFFCLFIGGTLLISYFVYKYLELPAQQMLRSRLS
jgi:peptidoglycan/LPS O-acetylase OafA/YrhL